jgi:protease IV
LFLFSFAAKNFNMTTENTNIPETPHNTPNNSTASGGPLTTINNSLKGAKITFGKVFWPALVALIVSSVLGWILFFIVLGGVVGSAGSAQPVVKDNTVLKLTLNDEVSEVSASNFNPGAIGIDKKTGLSALLFGFTKAAVDPKIKGIYLEIGDLSCGYGAARELRNAINTFEKSGKWVIAYHKGELISLKEYYIASAANLNYGFPSSTMEFLGLGAEYMFYKGMFDKLEVEAQVIRGKNNDFKSAVEPYFLDKMSDSSRLQVTRYMTSLWMDIRQDIATDRKIDINQLNNIAENQLIRRATDGVIYKLLDATIYMDELEQKMKTKLGLKVNQAISYFSFEKYADKEFESERTKTASSANVAVILAEGDVSTDGDGLSSAKITKYLREAREDDKIKTIVLRINSPGGSALASDEIWREVKLANLKKKVIVSMGDVAASGGYYIAAPASRIFAEKTTITGSIGVFGVIPYTGKMLENKLGVTFDRVSTNSSANMSLNKKLTPVELAVIQEEVDEIYTQFLAIVGEGRKMTPEQVNVIARGRVWTGVDALRIGLVDEIGGLPAAIKYASSKAGIKTPVLKYWPIKKIALANEVLENIMNEEDEEKAGFKSNKLAQEFMVQYELLLKMSGRTGIMARLPFDVKFD